MDDRFALQTFRVNGDARHVPSDALPIRKAPHNLEAEQALLGAILVNNEALGRVQDFVQPPDFYDPLHQQLYETIRAVIVSGQLASPITLRTFFETAEPVAANLSVPQYLGRLAAHAATIINARDYANTIRQLAMRRQLIMIGEDITRVAYDSPIDFDPRQQMAEAQTRLKSLEGSTPAMLTPVTLEQLAAADLTPQTFVLTDLLMDQGLMMVYGWRGVAKTWFVTGLGVAAASGQQFLKWKAPQPRRVFYIDGEMPAIAMRERLLPAVAAIGETGGRFRLLSDSLHRNGGLPDLASMQGQAAVDRHLDDAELVIVDNVSTLMRQGVENEAESWRPVQAWLLKLRREGRSVILVHHAGKGGAQRGTSHRETVLDVVLKLRHPDDYDPAEGARFEVHFEKGRGLIGRALDAFEARLEVRDGRAVWTTRDMEDARLADVRDLHADRKTVRQIAKELGMSRSAVQRAIAKLRASN